MKVSAFKAALKSGDIFYHAFAHNGEASTYPDASLFEAGIEVGERVADEVRCRSLPCSQPPIATNADCVDNSDMVMVAFGFEQQFCLKLLVAPPAIGSHIVARVEARAGVRPNRMPSAHSAVCDRVHGQQACGSIVCISGAHFLTGFPDKSCWHHTITGRDSTANRSVPTRRAWCSSLSSSQPPLATNLHHSGIDPSLST
jgi:hypothetical protein